MRFILIYLLLILSTLSAFAGSNLLDLMKANKTQYNTGCQNFIQTATHATLKSTELQKALIPAKSFRGMDLYYFHYTNAPQVPQLLHSDMKDRTSAQQSILKDGGYKALMEFQMTYSDALSNVSGVGFYIAANPFSSSSYGSTQIAITIDADAKVFDAVASRDVYSKVLSQKANQGFERCEAHVQFSLLMNENDADLAFYDENSQWFVAFNEDIFKESQITAISGNVLQSMARGGTLSPLMPYIREFNNDSNNISLSDVLSNMGIGSQSGKSQALKLFAAKITTWNDGIRFLFAKIISSASGSELTNLMSDFKNDNKVQDTDYFKVSYENSCQDFMAMIGAMIKVNPALMKDWSSDYTTRMAFFLSKNIVDMDFFLQNAPGGMSKDKLYSIMNDTSASASLRSAIAKYVVNSDGKYFQALKDDKKQAYIAVLMKGIDPKDIPALVNLTTKLGLDHYTLVRNMGQDPFGPNTAIYVKAVIRTQTDAKIINDSYYVSTILNNDPAQAYIDYVIEMRATKGISPEITQALTKKLYDNLSAENYTRLTDPKVLAAFSKSEVKSMVGRLVRNNSNNMGALLVNIMRAKGFSTYDISDTLYDNAYNAGSEISFYLLNELKKDAAFWTQYTSFKNSSGVVKIFNNRNAYQLQAIIKNNFPEIIFTPPFDPGLIDADRLAGLYSEDGLTKNFSKYSDEDKIRLLQIVDPNSGTARDLTTKTHFTPELIKKYLPLILADKDKSRLVIWMSSRPDFMASLSPVDFKSVIEITKKSYYSIDLSLIADPKIIDFDKAMYLSFSSRDSNNSGQDKMDAVFFDSKNMNPSQWQNFISTYIKGFDDLSDEVRNRYWSKVLAKIKNTPQVFDLISHWKKVDSYKRRELYPFYLASDDAMAAALKAFRNKSLNFFELVIEMDNKDFTSPLLAYIEGHYPVKEPYAAQLITSYSEGYTADLKKAHFTNFLCKKINNYQAITVAREELRDSYAKRYYDQYVQKVCNITIKEN